MGPLVLRCPHPQHNPCNAQGDGDLERVRTRLANQRQAGGRELVDVILGHHSSKTCSTLFGACSLLGLARAIRLRNVFMSISSVSARATARSHVSRGSPFWMKREAIGSVTPHS